MKILKSFFILVIITIVTLSVFKYFLGTTEYSNPAEKDTTILSSGTPLKFIVATDLHYISSAIVKDGPMFERIYVNSDGKQTNYITEITDTFINEVIVQNPNGLILSGDLTFNGEKKSHEELVQKLEKVKKNGIPVYVIPGNHDINNYNAVGFKEDSIYSVDNITEKDFQNMYQQFGLGDAIYQDYKSLSYVVEVSEDSWLIMLDSNKYVNNNSVMKSETSGAIRQETFDWLETVLVAAEKKGVTPITVMHHNLLEHNTLINTNFTIDNSEEVTELFHRFKVKVNLSGHIHAQHIASDQSKNNFFYDIVTSSLSVYPNQYGVLRFLPNEKISYQTKSVDMEESARENASKDRKLLHFEDYSYEFFYSTSYNKTINDLSMYELPKSAMESMAETFAEFNTSYFSGTINLTKDQLLNSEGYQLWKNTGSHFFRKYIDSVLLYPVKNENSITVLLK
ncbi:metallophosphoesterase [Saliterribacillus persicus]|uniref:3',5'-cyclic AMP phosphodiesterase CpdA n=1 Tax=Saliterribacillus persicus TaxID=930114 RepID=A0A368X5D7_9BACI|nr:metallophosphoesterase [Saliterribacillus persicus]RCW63153.1 3',5'-cyclic AMP phosphodiesterase CpdA [Saliterribacillus persicus]